MEKLETFLKTEKANCKNAKEEREKSPLTGVHTNNLRFTPECI